MNVQEMLMHTAFDGAQLLAGKKGQTREIKAFDVIEVPDIEDWLTEGVLLLTTFYSLKDQPDKQIDVFKGIIDANAAGLVVKIGRYIDDLPAEIYALAEQYDMPVISVPPHFPYISMTKILIENQTTQYFSEDEGLYPIISKLSKTIKAEVIVTNTMHEVVTFSRFPEEKKYHFYQKIVFPKIIDTRDHRYILSKNTDGAYGNLVFPLIKQSKVKGYLHIFCKNPDHILENHRQCINEATKLSLERLSEFETTTHWKDSLTSKELRKKLIRQTLDKSWSNPSFAAFSLALKTDHPHATNHIQTRNIFLEHIHLLLEEQFPDFYTTKKDDQFLVLITDMNGLEAENFKIQLEIFSQQIEDWFHKKPIFFISQLYDINEENIQMAIDECLYLHDVHAEFQLKGNIICVKSLGVNHYLYKLKKDDSCLQYSKNILQPIISYDQENKGHHLETLRVFLKNNGNQKKTAEDLFIHRRTLTYRLKRITDLTGLDVHDADDRLMLSIAIKLIFTKKEAGI